MQAHVSMDVALVKIPSPRFAHADTQKFKSSISSKDADFAGYVRMLYLLLVF